MQQNILFQVIYCFGERVPCVATKHSFPSYLLFWRESTLCCNKTFFSKLPIVLEREYPVLPTKHSFPSYLLFWRESNLFCNKTFLFQVTYCFGERVPVCFASYLLLWKHCFFVSKLPIVLEREYHVLQQNIFSSYLLFWRERESTHCCNKTFFQVTNKISFAKLSIVLEREYLVLQQNHFFPSYLLFWREGEYPVLQYNIFQVTYCFGERESTLCCNKTFFPSYLLFYHDQWLTHSCLVDPSILISKTNLFHILGVYRVLFYSISNRCSC